MAIFFSFLLIHQNYANIYSHMDNKEHGCKSQRSKSVYEWGRQNSYLVIGLPIEALM